MTGKDLLGIAVRIESAGVSYYTKLSERSGGNLRVLFQELAKQEQEHMRKFEELMKKYETDPDWATWQNEEAIGYAEQYARTLIFPELDRDEREPIPETPVAALRKAIEVEKDSIIYYNEIKSIVPDQKVIEDILKEEKEHLRKLSEKLAGEDPTVFSEGSMI